MKSIIRIVGLIVFAFVLTTTSGYAQGKSQDKGKAKKEKVKKVDEDVTEEVEDVANKGKDKANEMKEKGKEKMKDKAHVKEKGKKNEKSDDDGDNEDFDENHNNSNADRSEKVKKEKSNKGNAFGRDKGDMSGKEFGQYRASIAKEKIEESKDALTDKEETLNKGRQKAQGGQRESGKTT